MIHTARKMINMNQKAVWKAGEIFGINKKIVRVNKEFVRVAGEAIGVAKIKFAANSLKPQADSS